MASTTTPDGNPPPELISRRPRLAYGIGVALLIFTAVMVPIAIGSVILELFVRPVASVFYITDEPPARVRGPDVPTVDPQQANTAYLNIGVVSIDESRGLITLRVAGNRACATACDAFEMHLFSLGDARTERLGLPPSASISLPAGVHEVSTTVDLPVSGQPTLYPFDSYPLVLGTVALAVQPDGTTTPVRPQDRDVQLYMTLQSRLQRMTMERPEYVDPTTVRAPTDPYAFLYVRALDFHRPLYMQVLTILLVVLITAAAVYSVRMQPLSQLFTGIGGLVLGVWGIRSILVPGGPPYVTAVDLMLSMVILILLGGIIGRAALSFHHTLTDARRNTDTDG